MAKAPLFPRLGKTPDWLGAPSSTPMGDATLVRALIVSDGIESYQVLAPSTAFMNLNQLAHLAWDKLSLINPDPYEWISAIPGAYGFTVITDSSLLEATRLCIPGNAPDTYFELSHEQLKHRSSNYSFCEQILADPTPADRGRDSEQIKTSLETFTSRRITHRLEETLSIPPLPEAARGIIELEANPYHDLHDLTQVIELDPSLCARIIGWANSAYYQLDKPVTSVNDAIMRVLGFDKVKSIALGLALNSSLALPDSQVRGLSPYWLSAIFCASTMEAIAPLIQSEPRPDPGIAYLSGLLHNFGMLILGHVFPPMYADICKHQEANRHLPHTYSDQQVLGMPREVISSALLEAWSIPQAICDAIRFQHVHDYQAENAIYVKMLKLSQQMLAAEGIGDFPRGCIDPDIVAHLGLDTAAIERVSLTIEQSSEELSSLASVIGG